MAARYPAAQFRSLGAQTEPPLRAHDVICLHTMVGYLSSTDAMFKRDAYIGTESHFGIGGAWGSDATAGLDGVVYQWQDLDRQADANLDGNWHVISIETGDNAPRYVEDIAPWTAKQLDAIVDLVAWLCRQYAIPPFLIPDTKPGRRGIAYHRQGCLHSDGRDSHPGWLVTGGEKWSSALGKGCPGPARIAQLQNLVVPRVRATLAPPVLEDDVAFTIDDLLNTRVDTYIPVLDADGKPVPGKYQTRALRHLLGQAAEIHQIAARLPALDAGARLDAIEAALAEQRKTLAAIAAALTAATPPQPPG